METNDISSVSLEESQKPQHQQPTFLEGIDGEKENGGVSVDCGVDVSSVVEESGVLPKDKATYGGPLHLACYEGNTSMVESLLKTGADPNEKDRNEVTPLHYATYNNHLECVKLLLQNGASLRWKAPPKLPKDTKPEDLRNTAVDPRLVELNVYDQAPLDCLVLSADRMAILDSTHWASIRCTTGPQIGKWYYEVTIDTPGILQLGWVTRRCKFMNNEGVGDDLHGWAWDGCRQCIWYAGSKMTPFTPKWKVGDVVGCFVELTVKPKKLHDTASVTVVPPTATPNDNNSTNNDNNNNKNKTADDGFFSSILKSILGDLKRKKSGNTESTEGAEDDDDDDQIQLSIKKDRKMLARFGISLNGVDIGVWQTIEVVMDEEDRLYPAASVSMGEGCTFNFGHLPFKYPQTEYLSVINLVEEVLRLPRLRVKVGSALHWAAELGNAECLEQLLFYQGEEQRYPIKLAAMKDERGYLPIHLAAKRGHTECIKVLLKAKVEEHEASSIPLDESEYLDEEEDGDKDSEDDGENEEENNNKNNDGEGDDEEARRAQRKRKKQKREELKMSKRAKEEAKKRKRAKKYMYLDQVKRRDREGNTPLLHACTNGHLDTVKFLLKNGASLKDRNNRKMTPLLLASEGTLEMVRFLLDCGAAVEERDAYRNTPLLLAAHSSNPDSFEITKLLISQGSQINEKNKFGRSPLLLAAMSNSIEKVSYFLSLGSDVDEKDGDCDQNTPLLWAARNGHIDMLKFLISKGASVQATDQWGNTPLLLATFGGKIDLVEYLLSHGSSLKESNRSRCTGLCWAAQKGFLEIAKLLMAKGASLGEKDVHGNTPLLYAALGGQIECLKYFLTKGARIKEHNNTGCTAFLWACQRGHLKIVQYLQELGASLTQTDNHGNTCLMYASIEGKQDTVAYLLKQKDVDVKKKNNDGLTAMSWAARAGSAETLKVLMENGASVTEADNYGNTPLLYAAKANKPEAIQFLVTHGADIHEKDTQGNTAWKLALWTGKKEAAKYLLDEHFTSIHYPDMTDVVLENLCEIMEENSRVVELIIDNENIEDTDMEAEVICDMLSKNKHLTTLRINQSSMGVKGLEAIAQTVKKSNRSLLYFDFTPPEQTPGEVNSLVELVKIVKKIEGCLTRNRARRVSIAQAAIRMLVAARLVLPYHQQEKVGAEENDDSRIEFVTLPYELQEYIVLQVGGPALTDEEKKLILEYAQSKETLKKKDNGHTTRATFLTKVIKTVTYWPDTGSIVPPSPSSVVTTPSEKA